MFARFKNKKQEIDHEVHADLRKEKKSLSDYSFGYKFLMFWFLLFKDIFKGRNKGFREFGLTIFTGRQGKGKTVSMIEYLERMRRKYPNVTIVTNFDYEYATHRFEHWTDLINIRGEVGTIYALDELQNEFSNAKSKNFPEWILSEITQQRKQKVKIVATTQVFSRLALQLREQAFDVVECRTIAGRWTFTRCYDAYDFEGLKIGDYKKKGMLPIKWRRNFVQTEELRNLFDTYEKIKKISDDPNYEHAPNYPSIEQRGLVVNNVINKKSFSR